MSENTNPVNPVLPPDLAAKIAARSTDEPKLRGSQLKTRPDIRWDLDEKKTVAIWIMQHIDEIEATRVGFNSKTPFMLAGLRLAQTKVLPKERHRDLKSADECKAYIKFYEEYKDSVFRAQEMAKAQERQQPKTVEIAAAPELPKAQVEPPVKAPEPPTGWPLTPPPPVEEEVVSPTNAIEDEPEHDPGLLGDLIDQAVNRVVDTFARKLRSGLLAVSAKVVSEALETTVRSAQTAAATRAEFTKPKVHIFGFNDHIQALLKNEYGDRLKLTMSGPEEGYDNLRSRALGSEFNFAATSFIGHDRFKHIAQALKSAGRKEIKPVHGGTDAIRSELDSLWKSWKSLHNINFK